MADSKVFALKAGMHVEDIAHTVEDFLRNEKDLTVESFAASNGYLIQAKETSTWKKLTGLGNALQVQIIPGETHEVLVNVGMGKWVDKVGAAAVGALFFTPLLLTSAFGAYKQNKLPDEIFEHIERYLAW